MSRIGWAPQKARLGSNTTESLGSWNAADVDGLLSGPHYRGRNSPPLDLACKGPQWGFYFGRHLP